MPNSDPQSYTAKFTDGPLEGKTMTVSFLDSGDPQPRLEIPAVADDQPSGVSRGNRRYLYARGTGLEFGGDNSSSERPSAVDYRYLQVLVD